tara:strand:+ start:41083 stop:42648 length:1566 start_codon:yes stop_codon:yes gene_type:complete
MVSKFILGLLVCAAPAFCLASNSIAEIRSLCNELTNDSSKEIDGYKIEKRKDQLLIHVRRNCEALEEALDEGKIDDPSSTALFLDLKYIRDSWIQKFKFDEGLGIFDIMMMGASHQFSSFFLRYKIPESIKQITEIEPSIFWAQPAGPREKEFDRKAAEHGIKSSFRWASLDRLEVKGSAPKAHIIDLATGSRWLMKWGDEVNSDPVASRIFSALGFNTDYPYYSKPGEINLILGKTENKKKRSVAHFVKFIYNGYQINLSPFIKNVGRIDRALISKFPELGPFRGQYFVSFKSAAIDARPKDELRLGGMLSGHPDNINRRELRGAVLALLWLGVWDIKEINTLLSIFMNERSETKLIGSFSDLGVSMGVKINRFPRDIKASLVNEFPWDLVSIENGKIQFNGHVNAILKTYTSAQYEDLQWMAGQIAQIDEKILRDCLSYSGWPSYVQELYLFKLAERRKQILSVFGIEDAHPITINRMYSYRDQERWIVKDGFLVEEPSEEIYPQGLLHDKGRFRGFGW